jgi:hypothetical protein
MNINHITAEQYGQIKEAQNRVQGINDIKSICLNHMQFELIESKRFTSSKDYPTGEYQLFVHRKDIHIDEIVSVSSSSKTSKPSKINTCEHGSISHVGIPTSITEPFTNLMIGTKVSPLTIGIDTEWISSENQREILSYQFVTAIPEANGISFYALVVFPYASTFSLNRCLNILLNIVWKNHDNVFKPKRCSIKISESKKITDKTEALHIQLAAHFGCVDISSFHGAVNKIFPKLMSIQKTVVSHKPFPLKINDDYNNSRLAFVSLRDTMLLAVSGSSLSDIGDVLGIPKMSNSFLDNRMSELLKVDPKYYIEYALNDSYITLEYIRLINNGAYHKPLDITISSESCKFIKSHIMQSNNWSESDFDLHFRGLINVKRSKQLSKYTSSSEATPITADLLNTATECFMGGYNSALYLGIYNETCYDYDLSGAYPSAMSMSPDIDFTQLPTLIADRDITSEIMNTSPCDYGFGLISFEFPETCNNPCIPIRDTEGRGLIYPLKGQAYSNHPEVYLAVKLGASIYAHKWLIPKTTDIYSLRNVYEDLINLRNQYKNTYGEESFQELKQKLINNAGYGNLSRGITDKKCYSISLNKSEKMPPSSITCAPYASHATSLIRATILAAINGISEAGYTVLHATTDGLMSDIPLEALSNLSLYGFSNVYQSTLCLITGSSAMWKVKHQADINLSFRTRGNVGITSIGKGNLARAGYKLTYDELTLSQSEQCLLIAKKFLSRSGPIESVSNVLPSIREVMQKGKDYIGILRTTKLNMDWDWKRKLFNPKEETVTIDGTSYTHISCRSVPYKDMVEYENYKRAAENIKILKTESDYCSFLVTLANQDSNTRNTVSADKNIARSILRYIRTGQLQGFESLTGVEVTHRISGLLKVKLEANDYKKANIKERNQNILSIEVIAPYVKELGLTWVNK